MTFGFGLSRWRLISCEKQFCPCWICCSDIHQCWQARLQILLVRKQFQKRWSAVSISYPQSGQEGSIVIPFHSSTPRTGKALSSVCHKKIFIFGIISSFQIRLKSHLGLVELIFLCVAQVADFVLNWPEPVRPQQQESSASVRASGIPIIFFVIASSFTKERILSMSQHLSSVMISQTLSSGFCMLEVSRPSRSTRLALSHQLSHQNKMRSLLPTFHRMPFCSKSLLFCTLFQTGECGLLILLCSRSCDLRYLCFMIKVHKLSIPQSIFHTNLAWKAELTSSVFLSPKPPRLLGWQTPMRP